MAGASASRAEGSAPALWAQHAAVEPRDCAWRSPRRQASLRPLKIEGQRLLALLELAASSRELKISLCLGPAAKSAPSRPRSALGGGGAMPCIRHACHLGRAGPQIELHISPD